MILLTNLTFKSFNEMCSIVCALNDDDDDYFILFLYFWFIVYMGDDGVRSTFLFFCIYIYFFGMVYIKLLKMLIYGILFDI